MDFILAYLHQGLTAVVPFVVLLGLLIFVHELGHFAVAKWCGVRVEVFSLGFGKKILKYKRGDTTYALSLIPLGGYVKMFGDDINAELSAEDKKVAFTQKNVWQRIAIVLAGPLMNFFFAVFIFFLVAMLGEEARSPIIGDVLPSTPAYQAGLRSGDEIQSLGGEKTKTWEDFQHQLNGKVGQVVEISVKRYGTPDAIRVQVSPQSKPNPNLLSLDESAAEVDGLSNNSLAAVVGVRAKSPAEQMGLRTGDRIAKINGQEIKYFREIEPQLVPLQGQDVQLEVERWPSLESKDSENLKMALKLPSFAQLESLGIEKSELFLAKIIEKSPADVAGLRAGDRILAVSGKDAKNWEDVLATVKAYGGAGI